MLLSTVELGLQGVRAQESQHTGLVACSVWDLPDQGLNLCPLHRQADSQSLGQGKSKEYHFCLLLELGVV